LRRQVRPKKEGTLWEGSLWVINSFLTIVPIV
jgi:hypothetical protein